MMEILRAIANQWNSMGLAHSYNEAGVELCAADLDELVRQPYLIIRGRFQIWATICQDRFEIWKDFGIKTTVPLAHPDAIDLVIKTAETLLWRNGH